jgi:hypothetical protein
MKVEEAISEIVERLEAAATLREGIIEQLEVITKRIEMIESKIGVEGGPLGKREFDKRLQMHADALHRRIDREIQPQGLGRTLKSWASKSALFRNSK